MNPRDHGRPGERWRSSDGVRRADWLIVEDDASLARAVLVHVEDNTTRVDYAAEERQSEAPLSSDQFAIGDWEIVYPEHEKQAEVLEQAQAIGEFLDNGPYTLCERVTFDEDDLFGPSTDLVPVGKPITTILAEYFDIDLNKIEAEKRAMLDRLRAMNE